MKILKELNETQRNILLGSIIGDGEITKPYKNSRRKNLSYREHFGDKQLEYRKWKASFFDGFLYFRQNNTMVSKSTPIITELFSSYYDSEGKKHIPINLLKYCQSPYFISVIYMDDGSLLISKRINHNLKRIYITPVIALYLQCYTKNELTLLSDHLKNLFDFTLHLHKRNDGKGFILKTNKMKDTLLFLNLVSRVIHGCPSMYYKTNWSYRFEIESNKLKKQYPDYQVIATSSDRQKNYSQDEINRIIMLKNNKVCDQEIALELNRSYWSIVYKLSELRKKGHLT